MIHEVKFLSMSATSTTQYKRLLDGETMKFLKPTIKIGGVDVEMKPPEFKAHKGELSDKGRRNLSRSINNLLLSVDENMLLNGSGKDKIAFITLTLASSQIENYSMHYISHYATDKEIKRDCLNQFLTELKQQHGVKEFVWVAEKQVNGNLHFHMLVDKNIPFQWVTQKWNSLQNKFGFVDRYASEMIKEYGLTYSKESRNKYFSMREKDVKNMTLKKAKQILNAYYHGIRTKWMQPNSTDVHGLRKVKNVAAYIAKYMSKGFGHSESDVRKHASELSAKYTLSEVAIKQIYTIDGRIWQCSRNVSRSRKCVDFLDWNYSDEIQAFEKKVNEKIENVKVFVDEHFITICHTFKQLKDNLKSIHHTFINHIKNTFNEKTLLYNEINSNSILHQPALGIHSVAPASLSSVGKNYQIPLQFS